MNITSQSHMNVRHINHLVIETKLDKQCTCVSYLSANCDNRWDGKNWPWTLFSRINVV